MQDTVRGRQFILALGFSVRQTRANSPPFLSCQFAPGFFPKPPWSARRTPAHPPPKLYLAPASPVARRHIALRTVAVRSGGARAEEPNQGMLSSIMTWHHTLLIFPSRHGSFPSIFSPP